MSRLSELYQWFDQVKQNLPHLSAAQANGVALWSAANILSSICSLSHAETVLFGLCGQPLNTLRQRLREFYKDADHKCGPNRRELDVSVCFSSLLRWVASCTGNGPIALAVDASNFKDNFTLLCVSVLVRGCAVPVAWRVVRCTAKGSWQPIWKELLQSLKGAIGNERFVLVMADRGLYAKWLFTEITSLGWHPFLRINPIGNFTPNHMSEGPMCGFIPVVGDYFSTQGTAFRGKCKLECTILIYNDGARQPFIVLTDLPPQKSNPLWYGMRFWIERQFKTLKSAAMQLERSRIQAPDRFERILLPAAVALIYEIAAACAQEDAGNPDYNIPPSQRQRMSGTMSRRHSLPKMGAAILKPMLIAGTKLTMFILSPEPNLKYGIYNST